MTPNSNIDLSQYYQTPSASSSLVVAWRDRHHREMARVRRCNFDGRCPRASLAGIGAAEMNGLSAFYEDKYIAGVVIC